jgi:hypothetical protein
MVTNLNEEIRRDDSAVSTPQGRWLRHAGVLMIPALLSRCLYAGVWFLG